MDEKYIMERYLVMALCLAAGAIPGIAFSGPADLANGPLASSTASSTTVKPNIAFIVDDSGSMDEENMPDDDSTNDEYRCWGWKGYNTLFYDPAYIYRPPFKLDGAVYKDRRYADGVTRYPDAQFTEALKDGYFPAGGRTYGGGTGTNTKTDLSTLSNLTPDAVACSVSGNSPEIAASATIVFQSLDESEYYVASLTVDGVELLDLSASAKIPSKDGTKITDTLGDAIATSIFKKGTGYSAAYNGATNTLVITAPKSKKKTHFNAGFGAS